MPSGFVTPAVAGGAALVSCLLARDAALNIQLTQQNIKWDALYNNAVDFTPLAAIPTGLGLTFAFDGSASTLTTTTAGTWAFACAINRDADATWAGLYSLGSALSRPQVWPGLGAASSSPQVFTDVLTLPTGLAFAPNIQVTTAATAGTYNASAYLSIVRLG